MPQASNKPTSRRKTALPRQLRRAMEKLSATKLEEGARVAAEAWAEEQKHERRQMMMRLRLRYLDSVYGELHEAKPKPKPPKPKPIPEPEPEPEPVPEPEEKAGTITAMDLSDAGMLSMFDAFGSEDEEDGAEEDAPAEPAAPAGSGAGLDVMAAFADDDAEEEDTPEFSANSAAAVEDAFDMMAALDGGDDASDPPEEAAPASASPDMGNALDVMAAFADDDDEPEDTPAEAAPTASTAAPDLDVMAAFADDEEAADDSAPPESEAAPVDAAIDVMAALAETETPEQPVDTPEPVQAEAPTLDVMAMLEDGDEEDNAASETEAAPEENTIDVMDAFAERDAPEQPSETLEPTQAEAPELDAMAMLQDGDEEDTAASETEATPEGNTIDVMDASAESEATEQPSETSEPTQSEAPDLDAMAMLQDGGEEDTAPAAEETMDSAASADPLPQPVAEADDEPAPLKASADDLPAAADDEPSSSEADQDVLPSNVSAALDSLDKLFDEYQQDDLGPSIGQSDETDVTDSTTEPLEQPKPEETPEAPIAESAAEEAPAPEVDTSGGYWDDDILDLIGTETDAPPEQSDAEPQPAPAAEVAETVQAEPEPEAAPAPEAEEDDIFALMGGGDDTPDIEPAAAPPAPLGQPEAETGLGSNMLALLDSLGDDEDETQAP